MMKYGGRLLQICTRAGLNPNDTESIYKERGTGACADGAQDSPDHRWGEFGAFVSATFFQNFQDQALAKAQNQPPPAPTFVYGAADVEELFMVHTIRGLRRVLTAKQVTDPTIDVDARVRLGLKVRALPRIFGLMAPTTTAADLDVNTAPDAVEGAARSLRHGVPHGQGRPGLAEVRTTCCSRSASRLGSRELRATLERRRRRRRARVGRRAPQSPAAVPAAAPVLTTDNSVTAGRLWSHITPIDAFINAGVDDKAALTAMWITARRCCANG